MSQNLLRGSLNQWCHFHCFRVLPLCICRIDDPSSKYDDQNAKPNSIFVDRRWCRSGIWPESEFNYIIVNMKWIQGTNKKYNLLVVHIKIRISFKANYFNRTWILINWVQSTYFQHWSHYKQILIGFDLAGSDIQPDPLTTTKLLSLQEV